MNVQDFIDKVKASPGTRLVCGEGVEEQETILNPGMFVCVRSVQWDEDGFYRLNCDASPWEAHNKKVASRDWIDRDGKGGVDAWEAGYWKDGQCWLFLSEDGNPSELLAFVNSTGDRLYEQWRAEAPDTPYIAWLEERLARLEGLVQSRFARVAQTPDARASLRRDEVADFLVDEESQS